MFVAVIFKLLYYVCVLLCRHLCYNTPVSSVTSTFFRWHSLWPIIPEHFNVVTFPLIPFISKIFIKTVYCKMILFIKSGKLIPELLQSWVEWHFCKTALSENAVWNSRWVVSWIQAPALRTQTRRALNNRSMQWRIITSFSFTKGDSRANNHTTHVRIQGIKIDFSQFLFHLHCSSVIL